MRSRTVLMLKALRWLMEDRQVNTPEGRTFEPTPHGQEGHEILGEIEEELELAEGEGDGAARS